MTHRLRQGHKLERQVSYLLPGETALPGLGTLVWVVCAREKQVISRPGAGRAWVQIPPFSFIIV